MINSHDRLGFNTSVHLLILINKYLLQLIVILRRDCPKSPQMVGKFLWKSLNINNFIIYCRLIIMIYISCQAYNTFFFALSLLNKEEKITVITENNMLRELCQEKEIPCFFCKYVRVSWKNPLSFINFKLRSDLFIRKNIKISKNDTLYFFDNGIAIFTFYLAMKWTKKGGIVKYNAIDYTYPIVNDELNIARIKRLEKNVIRLFLGLDLIFRNTAQIPIYGIDNYFLEKNKVIKFNPEMSLSEMRIECSKKNFIRMNRYDNLIITGADLGSIDQLSIERIITEIYPYLLDCVVKFHPKVKKNTKNNAEEICFISFDSYPEYIPVEILLKNINKNVIAIMSSSLITSSYLSNIQTISLLELVEWYNIERKESIKSFLVRESKNKILFPSSVNELKMLIEDFD